MSILDHQMSRIWIEVAGPLLETISKFDRLNNWVPNCSAQEFDEIFLGSKHVLKVTFKHSLKNKEFFFILPVPILPGSVVKTLHLNVRTLYCHISLFGFLKKSKITNLEKSRNLILTPHMKKLFLFNSQKGKLRRSKEYRKRDVRSATSTHLQRCRKVWKSWRGVVIWRLSTTSIMDLQLLCQKFVK